MKQEPKEKIYTPREAAKKLGISVRMLQYYRETGRIQGTPFGNTTFYTEEQLAKANLRRFKTGPKTTGEKQEYREEDKEDYAYAGLA